MNSKFYKMIIVLLIIILGVMGYWTMQWYPDYQNRLIHEQQLSINGLSLRDTKDIMSGLNIQMKNGFQYNITLDVEEIMNNELKFDVITGHIYIALDLLRNNKIIHSLGDGILRTTEDGTSHSRATTCMVIGTKELEGCLFVQPNSYLWKEKMKFQNYESGDKILITIKESLLQGNSIFNWSMN